jgi:predicted regulator of Ras-like GTPase activity (Roadblock/LC7/MglB family)
VDASQALADLVEISSQIESAVLADGEGAVLASTFGEDEKASAIVREAIDLLQGATGPGGQPSQVQIAFLEGSVFVVRDGERIAAAVTGRDPTSGLVFYDLKTCLRLAAEPPPRKEAATGARRRSKKKDDEPEESNGET